MGWLQDHGWVAGLLLTAALALGGLAWWQVRRRPARGQSRHGRHGRVRAATPVPGAAARRRVDLTFAAAVLVTLGIGAAAVLWLLGQADQVPAGKDRAAAQADAVKTGATIALGTGGAAYLLLAYRRQRLEEVDTRERRITELYSKAVDQLGHDKAPVRLGGLYSLERLAQNNPEHRHTVVGVICAYLRMPYTPPTPPARATPGVEPTEQAGEASVRWYPDPAPAAVRALAAPQAQDPAQQELQVRLTAQRLLADHLRRPPRAILGLAAERRRPSPRRGFWPDTSLDLTGAALIDLTFDEVSVAHALFTGATFHGAAGFDGATFHDYAGFAEATFHDYAGFAEPGLQRHRRVQRGDLPGARHQVRRGNFPGRRRVQRGGLPRLRRV
jgi:Pentapeptide repeats (9 copies)